MRDSIGIKVTTSSVAITVAVIHVIWPSLSIDAITLGLLAAAILPWLTSILKSVETPAGWKVEFHELQKVQRDAEQSGLIEGKATQDAHQYSFQQVAGDDPNLALAGLRIELEKVLRELVERTGVRTKSNISQYFGALVDKKVLNQGQINVLAELLPRLNAATHGAEVDPRASEWATDVGARLLR